MARTHAPPKGRPRWGAAGIVALLAALPNVARAAGVPQAVHASDAELADALRRGAAALEAGDAWGSPAIRALIETGETGQSVAVELSRGDRKDLRHVASWLLARAEQEGSWNALLALDRLGPPVLGKKDPDAEGRELSEIESRLPRLEVEFPGDWRAPDCGNSSIGERSKVLGEYVRLGPRACPSLSRLVRDPDAVRRWRALQVLAVVECPARREIVARALGDADPRVRQQAVLMLGATFPASCDDRDALHRMLANDDVPCRIIAAGALSRCGDVSALPVLLASARIAAETDDEVLLREHSAASGYLPSLTSYEGRRESGSFSLEERRATARWWTEWGESHASGFDVRAAHLEALRGALDFARANPQLGNARSPSGRWPDLRALLQLDEAATVDLLLDDLAATQRAGFDLALCLRADSPGSAATRRTLERIARDAGATLYARREAVRLLARLDAERARAVVVSLLRSSRPGDREAAWGPESRELARDEVRRAALEALASAGPGDARPLYRDLRDLAGPEDCAALLPMVLAETDMWDQIAGWALLGRLRCPDAEAPMRARLSDVSLGRWLAEPIASYRDLRVIPDLPCIGRGCASSEERSTTLRALSIILDRRTVPGLVHALSEDDPAFRFGAASALRVAIREEPKNMMPSPSGARIDFSSARLHEPYVRAALERAAARAGDPAAGPAREALALMDVGEGRTER